ncbi:MAG: DUF1845 domain-containing protein [Gammaproteobacteria bacterium]|nr:MAG: DUF1845 domain-containing protein [Gammaproteobacteria bacterium]
MVDSNKAVSKLANKQARKPVNRFDPRLVQSRVGEVESLLSRAVMYRPITLLSLHAQRVIWRQFLGLRRSLFSISVILPLVFQDDHESIEAVEKSIETRFSEARKTLTTSKQQLQETLKSDGINNVFDFNNKLELNVAIDTPLASQFVDLVLLLDELVQYIETVWLSGNIDNKHRNIEVNKWEKTLMRLSVTLIQHERRVKNAAKQKGIATEVGDELEGSSNEVADSVPELPTALNNGKLLNEPLMKAAVA